MAEKIIILLFISLICSGLYSQDTVNNACTQYLRIYEGTQFRKINYSELSADSFGSLFINDLETYQIITETLDGRSSDFHYEVVMPQLTLVILPDFPERFIWNYVEEDYTDFLSRAKKLPIKSMAIAYPSHQKDYCVEIIKGNDAIQIR